MMEPLKNKMKTKLYYDDIYEFCNNEFDEEMDGEKKAFFDDAQNMDNDRFLITASRGFGKTYTLARLALWSCTVIPQIHGEEYNVSILGGSREQSNKAYSEIVDCINNSDYVKQRVDGEPIKTQTRFNDGSTIRALAASTKSVRGGHPHCLIMDECAEIDRDLVTAATESLDNYRTEDVNFPKRLVLSSTPHVYDSFFVEHLQNPDKWGFRTYKWKASDSWNKSEEEIRDAKRRLDEKTFQREWMGKPVSMSGTLIDSEDLQNSVIQYIPDTRSEGYITAGVDWGFDHPTALVIVQKQDGYDYILEAKKWREKKFEWIKDKIMELYNQYEIDEIQADNSHQPVIQRLRDEGAHIRAVSFSTDKNNMISNMLFKFENGRVKIPHRFGDLREELEIYHRDRREKDDMVDALMLALKGQKNAPKSSFSKDESDIPISLGGKRT